MKTRLWWSVREKKQSENVAAPVAPAAPPSAAAPPPAGMIEPEFGPGRVDWAELNAPRVVTCSDSIIAAGFLNGRPAVFEIDAETGERLTQPRTDGFVLTCGPESVLGRLFHRRHGA